MEQKARLWTKDFTIITLGSVVSMFGSAVAGYAIGLLVLEKTQASIFLYALFAICYSLPRIVFPLLAGPFLDRFSRRKAIYTLDFISAVIYAALYLLLRVDFFHYPLFLLMSMVIGSIDSVYQVAYDSLYPNLISKGNCRKAYSVSSLIYPLATAIMVPIAGFSYESIGVAPLFLFNAVTFLIAAIFETQIRASETHVDVVEKASQQMRLTFRRFITDFRAGISYLRQETGLMTITVYFFVNTLMYSVAGTLLQPYFYANIANGVQLYALIMSANTLGRLLGGSVQYFVKYPTGSKFAIAIFVYLSICLLDGSYLFTPFWCMLLLNFLSGTLAVTSFNIRISATQNYVDDKVRGRFNGVFQMLNMLGGIAGQLIAGAIGDLFPVPYIVIAVNVATAISVFLIVLPRRESVKLIYNVEV